MTIPESMNLELGDRVTVPSGKLYELTFVYPGTCRLYFRQVRANSKGEVVLYGPTMPLKPENMTKVSA